MLAAPCRPRSAFVRPQAGQFQHDVPRGHAPTASRAGVFRTTPPPEQQPVRWLRQLADGRRPKPAGKRRGQSRPEQEATGQARHSVLDPQHGRWCDGRGDSTLREDRRIGEDVLRHLSRPPLLSASQSTPSRPESDRLKPARQEMKLDHAHHAEDQGVADHHRSTR